MDKFIVYKITNTLNGKVYIGITKFNNPNNRWKNGFGYRKNSLISKAIKKYGWEIFTKEILHNNLSKETACNLEIEYIKHFKNLNISYNIANGGEGSNSISEETKEKLRQYNGERASMYGKKHTKESIEKIRKSSKGRLVSLSTKQKISDANKRYNGMRCKTHTEKVKKLISDRFSIPVIQYTLHGDFIKEYPSITQAQLELNIKSNHIGCCCIGRRKTCNGFIWKYKNTQI